MMKLNNMKWLWLSLVLLALAGTLLWTVSRGEGGATIATITGPAQMNSPEYSIGLPQGAAAMTAGERAFPQANLKYYNSLADAYTAVEYGKIDGFLFDRHPMEYVARTRPSLALLTEKIADERVVIGAPFANRKLMNEVNAFIRQYRADGTYRQMYARWITLTAPDARTMPVVPEPVNPTRTIRIGTEGLNEPMSFYGSKGELTGFDLEFSKRLALFLNARVDIRAMAFPALIASAESGKIDLLVSGLNGTPQQGATMLLSEPYIDSEISMLVRRDRLPPENQQPSHTFPAGNTSGGPDSESAGGAHKQGASLDWFRGKRIAILNGTVMDQLIEKAIPGRTIQFLSFNDQPSMLTALKQNKADAVAFDKPEALYNIRDDKTIALYPASVMDLPLGFAFRKGDPLCPRATEIIRQLRKDGTLEEMTRRWCYSPADQMRIPSELVKKNQTLPNPYRFGCDMVTTPMCYIVGQMEPAGFDAELAMRIGVGVNRRVEFVQTSFGGLIPALQSGKADMVGGCMAITSERQKQADFVESYYMSGIALVVRRADFPEAFFHADAGAQGVSGELAAMAGKSIAVPEGTKFDQLVVEKLPGALPVIYTGYADMLMALEAGKVDGIVVDEPVARRFEATGHPVRQIPQMLSPDEYAFIFPKERAALRDEFNAELTKMRLDGTLRALVGVWLGSDEVRKVIPASKSKGERGELHLVINDENAPFDYVKDGKVVGLEPDLAVRIFDRLGYKLRISAVNMSGLLPMVMAGKADVGACCISITEERKQQVLFSDPHYQGGVVVLVAAKPQTVQNGPAESGFFAGLRASFHRTFLLESRYALVLQGLGTTVVISVFSILFGTLLGFAVCLLRRSRSPLIRLPMQVYIRAVQGTPILVLLMILYYIVFGSVDISAVLVAVIGFAVNVSAYVAEMLRAGIDAVDRGQIEAASAMGFSPRQVFLKIILPQAARHILPVFKGEVISTVKMTSIVGYIAIQDLTKVSDIIRSRTFEAFFPLLSTAVIYFIIAYGLTLLLALVEINVDPRRRKRVVRGVKVQS